MGFMKNNLNFKPLFTSRRHEQQWSRMQAVKMSRQGMSVKSIAAFFEVSGRAVYKWLTTFNEGGQNALAAKEGAGRPPKLSPQNMRWLALTIRDSTPNQLKFEFGLWTLRLIGELIQREFNWSPSKPTLIKLMRILGFTPQRPLRRAWQQDDVLVQKWRSEVLPSIVIRAKAKGAAIFFGDEAGIRTDYHAGTTWAPCGKTPIVKKTGSRFSMQMISAISASGEIKFMLHEGTVNSEVFLIFLEQLMHGATRPIILILDGHSIHKSKIIKDYVSSTNGMLELEYLPPYSPQLNPDEQVWKNIKERVSKKLPLDKYDLRRLVTEAFDYLKKSSHIVAGFFRHPELGYSIF